MPFVQFYSIPYVSHCRRINFRSIQYYQTIYLFNKYQIVKVDIIFKGRESGENCFFFFDEYPSELASGTNRKNTLC